MGSVLDMTAGSSTTTRAWKAAFTDLSGGWQQRQLWAHLGWQDIRQRYRRSLLGPIWISITMAVTAIALGILLLMLLALVSFGGGREHS